MSFYTFKIAIRKLFKNGRFTIINVLGLSLGVWSCLMVATVVINDLSFDRQWTKSERLYRIISVSKMGEGMFERQPSSFTALAPEIVRNFPDAEGYSELYVDAINLKLPTQNRDELTATVMHADTSVWNLLDLHILSGNPKEIVSGVSNLVITKSFKEQFFPGVDPVGRVLQDIPKYDEESNPFQITGVIEDLPYNSHLRSQVIWLHKKKRIGDLLAKENIEFSKNYLLLKEQTDPVAFIEKVNNWYSKLTDGKSEFSFELQPISEVYLHSEFADNQPIKGNYSTVYILSGVAILILLIACSTYINLSCVISQSRIKETGVRRILSGSRRQLILFQITESLLLFLSSGLISLIIYFCTLSKLQSFLETSFVFTFTSDFLLFVLFFVTVGLLSLLVGLYPALITSGMNPLYALKGMTSSSPLFSQIWLRRGLVVFQLSISIGVLIAMLVVRGQLELLFNKDLGYSESNLLCIDHTNWGLKGNSFKSELLQIPGVVAASTSQWLPSKGGGFKSRDIQDPTNPLRKIKVWFIAADTDFAKTMGFQLQSGRLLSDKYGADAINKDSLQLVDWDKYIEQSKMQPSLITNSVVKDLRVKHLNTQIEGVGTVPVGVIENFNNESMYESRKPTIIVANKSITFGGMLVRTAPGTELGVMKAIRTQWAHFYPDKILKISLVSDLLKGQYKFENKLHQLFLFFSVLTIVLSALGIFGLVLQSAEQRMKEIGVRKALGASIPNIVAMVAKDFIKLVGVAFVISSAVATYILSDWLLGYPYHIELNAWFFVLAGGIALFVTFLTISYQIFKMAMVNPVLSLRGE